jgi:hypothetical protein
MLMLLQSIRRVFFKISFALSLVVLQLMILGRFLGFNTQIRKGEMYQGALAAHSLHNVTNNNGLQLVDFATRVPWLAPFCSPI